MKTIDKLRSSMAANIIGAVVALLVLFGSEVGLVGVMSYTKSFKNEYSVTTYHMADTAASVVNGDRLDEYLAGEETEDYERTKRILDSFCKRMNVSLVYVIQVDTSDYDSFVSVFNSVNNSVDNSSYTEWEIGHKRHTTNNEYSQEYKALYEQGARYETVYRTNPSDGSHPHITTMVPVRDSSDKVTGILCVQRPIREMKDARKPYLLNIGVSTILLSLVAAFIAAFYIRKLFVAPILKVSDEATRFARESIKGQELGKISNFTEIRNLANSIDTMETDMVNYMENLTAVTAERERIGAELSFASQIQENSLPNEFPAFPDRNEFDIYASMKPAKEVGGDFYNFFLIDDDHLAMVIGDVSGKGVPGALFMMVTNIVLTDRTQMGGTPSEILNFVNSNICEHNRSEMFITLWLGILKISTGKLTFANAGHDDAAVCRRDGNFELFRTKHGLVVGAMPDLCYRDFEIRLQKGDKLFLYTDGIPEAMDRDNQMYTTARMLDALNENKEKPPKEILEGIHRSVAQFVGDAPQFDDVTMLCIEIK